MRRLFIIFFLVSYPVCTCYGQGSKIEPPLIPKVKKYVISRYDTFIPPINFEFFSHMDGLPEGEINGLTQTDDGYLWMSIWNYGLVRYDGYHFRSFIAVTGDSNSMPMQCISDIVKGKNVLWLVGDKGLVRFDLKTYKSEIIHHLPKQFLQSGALRSCVEDRLGQLWLFGEGLFLYHPEKQSFEKIRNAVSGSNGKTVDISTFLFRGNGYAPPTLAPDGSVWMNGCGLTYLNPKTKVVTCYPIAIDGVLPDPDGTHVWLSGIFFSIGRYNFKENSLEVFNFIEDDTTKPWRNHYFLSHIENGKLWITSPNTIKVMDVKNFRTQMYKSKELRHFNVMEKGSGSIRWTRNNNDELLANFSEASRITYQKILPETEKVLSYWKDENKNVEWFGTVGEDEKGKLYRYDLESRKISEFPIPAQPCSPFVLSRLNDHQLLVGAGGMIKQPGKLFLFDMESLSFTPITKSISNYTTLTTDSFEYQGACVDKQNNIWLSVYEDGFIKYETASNQFYLVTPHSRDISSPTDGTDHIALRSSTNFFCSNDGFIWTSGKGGTLTKINTQTGKVEKVNIDPENRFIVPLCEDLQGNLYLSVYTGMYIYITASKKLFQIPGMPSCSKAIVDSNANIIALAPNGLWFYNSKLKIARKFNSKDGIKGYGSDYSLYTLNQSAKDEVLISDKYRFPISSLYPRQEVPPLHLTSIKVNGKELTTTYNVDDLDTLVLKYNQNQLSFEFAALSFLPHDANSYACILQGLDTAWQQLGTSNATTYSNLSPGKYTFKVKTANRDGVWGEEKKLYINIIPAFWQTIWFKAVIVLVIAGLLYWLYRNRLYQLTLKNNLEREKLYQQQREAEFQKKLADLTLSALRSQINPHFIFNCLNSIKLYATQNDMDAASGYLTKFSRLIRQVLENSKNDMITLSIELEVLRLYIEMEAMRFKEKLKYDILVEENVDTEYIEIPPLLLQPYVENAIWHGLMHKEEGGHLEIKAAMSDDEEDMIIITIKDDGVGRAKAAEFKSKSAVQHKSFGLKLSSERLALISQLYQTHTTVKIDDLKDDKGMAAGTLVTIQIKV